ncbi:MAG: glutamate-1-semialdehyde 2,1-aminomutase [Bdellovibrionales bacterium]|nr:glutamate-1-semialdehyde 2,1-aminomutase [Bdellovibrionales bacterium]
MKNEKNLLYSKRAKRLIPGGAHTYSKGDDQFPENAPKIIERGLGAKLWDVDGNEFLDFGMSLGSVLLGHAYEPVLEAVRNEIKKGVNFVRPSIIEGELAELINETIPCAEMVKFAKNGSDAVTAAVKLARAYTGRDYIARCSADPFNAVHDWFIGSTVVNRGVPKVVQDLTLKFNYNDLKSCETLFDQHPGQIAAFILEPLSMIAPEPGFLEGLQALCKKNGTVLIFDEVVSGFRFSLGGAQEKLGITPDLAAFGKAMANGFSVSALVGKKEIMELGGLDHKGERVFLLSTTHGGETHSLAAAIKTITEIRDKKLIPHFWSVGSKLKEGILSAASRSGLQDFVQMIGFDCKPALILKDKSGVPNAELRTLFLQETVERGLLIPYMVPGFAHGEAELKRALEIIEDSFNSIKKKMEDSDIGSNLLGDPVKPVFRKFNSDLA